MEKNKEKVLMHTCCAPCSIVCIDILNENKYKFDMFWYNPNIHPYTEYKKRLETLEEYTKQLNINLIVKDEYILDKFVSEQIKNLSNKCARVCYNMRLEETAKMANMLGYLKYTTTLLVSPYQDREKIIEIGNMYGKKYNVEFIAPNFQERFWEGQNRATELGLYKQKYCGCIFSEAERYKKSTWNIKK